MTQNTSLTPFRIDIPQDAVDDLHDRLARTRWPFPVPGRDDRTDFRRGIPLPYLKELAEYWREGFDWRMQEAALNTYEQFTTVVDGQPFHVLHVRSANPEATPLLLSDSWPASFVEYQRLLPLLTDEFHVVIPSLPGLGFSTPLSGTGWDLARTTEAYAEIMTRFGYDRFAAHGSDVGTGRSAATSACTTTNRTPSVRHSRTRPSPSSRGSSRNSSAGPMTGSGPRTSIATSC
ncbi:epoxide hydrolase family protein [Microbacterium oxydans]|uniref:epoxide hydrolase family protein n=1 Tax=Microbacterium oxydans TaxID=82380 RepID=UPI00226B3B37|nr:alpha/beta fold hydrolase [Microbacterium oxydans]WAA66091.1 epoxide hydrolase N-terminal domain-containing protein [Microbacterium oxydans]